ncbi:endonuclease domain-containing protein [Streptomyces albospinus]|uniref:endonuclease domain-containing protein n=1 Tax=Streptomyces albospinus TaxID=285515 RepID=UPI001670CB27|nr:endonuclease domain-containing protein [Streptomyces albospinus]
MFFGHVPVRSYKHAGQWQFMPKDVLRAGRTVAELPWDPEDLVCLEPAEQEAWSPDGFTRTGWRTEIRRVIDGAGAGSGCCCHPPQAAAAQQPCHTAPDCLLRQYQDYTIACTLPVRALMRAGESWMIPRTLAFILDQRDEVETRFHAARQPCDGCGALSPDGSWRTPTATGWKIICPACAAASLRRYRRELQGAAYACVREHGPSPANFLCAVCETARPATDWDHCHAHGLIRGPLCVSCNTMEGQGKEFLARPGSVQYLLHCDGCRAQRSLPPHHRLAALRRHLHLTRGAQGCDWPMHMHVTLEEADGGYDFTVHCSGSEHRARAVRSVRLTHEEAEHVLSHTVEEGLTQEA